MKKKIAILMLIVLFVSFTYAQDVPMEDFKAGLRDFLGNINASLPDSSVAGATWSDAYIGQIIGIPPHFGVGVAGSVVKFNVDGLKAILNKLGNPFPIDSLVFPSFAIEGRIGGFFLPFDIGARFGFFPEKEIKNITFNYLNYGADIRFAVLKQNVVLPNLSLAVGYYGTKGGMSYTFNAAELVKVEGMPDQDGKMAIDFMTNVIDARLQVSKSILIATPYVGAAASYTMTESSYNLIDTVTDILPTNEWQYRVFGGLSFNILVVKIDVSGMWNFVTKNWGANLGVRVQI